MKVNPDDMAKFYYKSKLTSKEQEDLLMDLCDAIASINNSKEAAQFLKDLLSPQEAEMLAKRIKIAELLLSNWDYKEIKDYLKVGESTIARVSEWLKFTGDGYRLVTERLREKRKSRLRPEPKMGLKADIKELERRYPLMFWPELLIEGLIKNAKIKNKKKVLENLGKMRLKPSLYKEIEKELKKEFSRQRNKS